MLDPVAVEEGANSCGCKTDSPINKSPHFKLQYDNSVEEFENSYVRYVKYIKCSSIFRNIVNYILNVF